MYIYKSILYRLMYDTCALIWVSFYKVAGGFFFIRQVEFFEGSSDELSGVLGKVGLAPPKKERNKDSMTFFCE